MRIRKEENRPSVGEIVVENDEADLSRCGRLKRKCAEEANELIKAVIGSEMLNISPEDSFESSGEEHKIFTSVFCREKDSGSYTENTSMADALSEGCDRKTGLSKSSDSISGGVRMRKRLKIMENARDELTLWQEHGTKQNGVTHLASQHLVAAEKMDTSNQLKVCQDIDKAVKFIANENHISNNNGYDLQEKHDISDSKVQAELEKLEGKSCPNNVVQGEQTGKLSCKVQTQHSCHQYTIGSSISASQAKKTEQRMIYPIVESSEGGMLLRSNGSSCHEELNVCESFKAEWVLKNSGDTHKEMVSNYRALSFPGLSEENLTANNLPITELRKSLREQAKARLLAAGWKIEFKPRAGKQYQDSIYVSPWGSAFWSLPKAWNALRKSLGTNATKNGNISSTMQLRDRKRPHPRGRDFWSEVNKTLEHLDSGEQHCIVSMNNRDREIDPLMSMILTEDLSLLRKRKKDRCKEGEWKQNTYEKYEQCEHSMKGYENGHSSKVLGPLKPIPLQKSEMNPCEFYRLDSGRVVCKERDILGTGSFSGYQKSMKGDLLHADDLSTTRKLSSSEEVRNMHGKLVDGGDERNIQSKVLHAGSVSYAQKQQTKSGNLEIYDPCDAREKLFYAGDRNMHDHISKTEGKMSLSARGIRHGKHLSSEEPRGKHGDLLQRRNSWTLQRKISSAGEEMGVYEVLKKLGMHEEISDASEQRSMLEICDESDRYGKLFVGREERSTNGIGNISCARGKHSDDKEQRTMCGSSKKNGIYGAFSNGREQSSLCGKACHMGGQRCRHKVLLSTSKKSKICKRIGNDSLDFGKKRCIEQKRSSSCKLQNTHEMVHAVKTKSMSKKQSSSGEHKCKRAKLLHAEGERDIHHVQSHVTANRTVYDKMFPSVELKEELFPHRQKSEKLLQKPISTESRYHELCNKSILKGLHLIEKEISHQADGLLSSTKMNGETEKQPSVSYRADLEMSHVVPVLQKTEDMNYNVPMRDLLSKNAQVRKPSMKSNGKVEQVGITKKNRERERNSKKSEACQKSDKGILFMAKGAFNESKASRVLEDEFDKHVNKSQVDKAVRIFNQRQGRKVNRNIIERDLFNQRQGRKVNRNIIERDLSRQLSKLELEQHSCKRENGARKSMEPLVAQEIDELERIGQFDEHQAFRFSRSSSGLHVGMKTKDLNDSLAVKESHRKRVGKVCEKLIVSQADREPYSWANKTGRKSKELQAGRLLNDPLGVKCPKNCAESIDCNIENEIILDDDNITLASMLKNKKRLSLVAKDSGVLCAKNKPVTGRTIYSAGEKNKHRKGGCVLSVRSSSKKDIHSKGEKGDSSSSKRTALSWLIDTGVVSKGEPVEYLNTKTNRVMKHGWITRDGIYCRCCNRVLTISRFSTHAGSKIKWPFLNIFVQSGKSLTICQIEAWSAEFKFRKGGTRFIEVNENDLNDDACGFCGDGGDLICCDNCPSTFHQDCLTLEDVPEGNWYCANCICAICGTINHDEEDIASNFLICDQCEVKYHKKCLHERAVHVGELNAMGDLLCGEDCRKVSIGLRELLGISNSIGEGLTWTLLRSINEDRKLCSPQRLAAMADCNTKLALALSVMEECFERMLDPRTGIDMIPHVVYCWGSNFSRLNYQGFYTVILEREDELISVASIRIHGRHFAEMPLIATCLPYRRQGMCRRLVNTIEKMLMSLNVEKLILSAVSDLLEYWTTVFGFKPLEDSDKQELKNMNIMTFPGTALLQKFICRPESNKCFETVKQVDQVACVEGNVLLPQTQGDDPLYPQLEKTDMDSALSIVGDIRDANSLMQIPPLRMFANVEEQRCEETTDNTSMSNKERTTDCHQVDVLDAQAQVDNDIPVVEKFSTESSFSISVKAETAHSNIMDDTKMSCQRSSLQLNYNFLGAQLEGDTDQVLVFEKTRTGDTQHASGDIAVIDTAMKTRVLQEETESANCGKGTEKFEMEENRTLSCLEAEKLNPAHRDGLGQKSMINRNSSVLCPQMQKDIEVVLDKTHSMTAELVPENIAYIRKIEDTKRFPEEEEMCNEGVEKSSETERQRTLTCLENEQFGSQAVDFKVNVHQKAQTESVAGGQGAMAEVRMLRMTENSQRSSEAKERCEHDKDSESGTAVDEKRTKLVFAKTDMQDLTYIDMEGRILSDEVPVNSFVKDLSDSFLDKIEAEKCTNDFATVRDLSSDLASTNLYTIGSSGDGDNICYEQRNVDS